MKRGPKSPKDWSRDAYPLGTIRIRQSGKSRVRMIKITHLGPKPKRWLEVARHWWLKNKGPIPTGKRVVHLDGDTLNDNPTNYGLMTAGEIICLYHRMRPAMSARNHELASKATAQANRERGQIRRAISWLPTRWYCVDPQRRIIYNRPFRQLWQSMQDAGIPIERANWRLARRILLATRTPFVFMRGQSLACDEYKAFQKSDSPPTIEGVINGAGAQTSAPA